MMRNTLSPGEQNIGPAEWNEKERQKEGQKGRVGVTEETARGENGKEAERI